MAPPPNLERRRAIADGAIEVLAGSGVHGLSHRAVDEAVGLPAGTTSNYFRSRDALLTAAAERVVELHQADMAAAHGLVLGPIDRDGLVALIGASLEFSATAHRARYLAVYELTLEATRRPALQQALDGIKAGAVDFTLDQHRALGLHTTREDVATLITLFGGALYTLVTGQAGAVNAATTRALAQTMVAGVASAR
ncbi:TetR/AcrR family transcriptional regulator [Embleya scabrispora]|uniref:TetR/AcrR family transcriptional regulator n=1 Tax=Embleya scabrispora TaxID=159449 RepID=UPI00035E4F1B|nr:TetR/AcrR family transcriptional regulator [Embleya scabrispora]MYS86010.1 TetR family transcriptional regulator [Streptomyces sp. SID5474]